MRRTPYVTTKNVYIRGAGLREYSRVIRGEGVGSRVSRVSKGLNKLWKNPKLRKKLRETATKIGQKLLQMNYKIGLLIKQVLLSIKK